MLRYYDTVRCSQIHIPQPSLDTHYEGAAHFYNLESETSALQRIIVITDTLQNQLEDPLPDIYK